jgi:PAS domain S-box-containing protein
MAQPTVSPAEVLIDDRTVTSVAELAVRHLADWAMVDVLQADGSYQRVAAAHRDPAMRDLVQQMLRWAPEMDDRTANPVAAALREGRLVVAEDVPDELLVRSARDADHLATVRALAPTAYAVIPMMARERVVGVLTLAKSDPGGTFSPNELRLAEEFVRGCALAIDNALLYREAQEEVGRRLVAERAASSRLAELEATYATAPVGLCVIDTELRWVRINQKLAEMNGWPVEAHLGRNVRELLPEVADVAEPALRRVLKTGEPLLDVILEGATPAAPGVRRIWLENFYPLRDAAGRVIGVNIVAEEITGRLRAEADLKASEELRRLALEAAGLGTWRFDPATGATEWDERARDLFGITDPNASMEDVFRRIHPDDEERVRGEVAAAFDPETGQGYDTAYRLHCGPGDLRWLRVQGRVLSEPGPGGARRYVGLVSDETAMRSAALERERLLGDLATLNVELERRVEERTRALQAAVAEQESFVYTVSHDLKAPLLSMQGMTTLLAEALDGGDLEDARFYLDRLRRNVTRMGGLLTDLLALARIATVEEHPEEIPLDTAISAAVNQVEPYLTARRVEVRLPEVCPAVFLPRSELDQVLTNLLSNAAKWAGREGRAPVVQIGCIDDGARVTLRVEDNGPGIPAQHRERVWGLFQRLDSKTEGTGVGLAIVKRIIERHGGRAGVEESALGGAAFVVTLPGPRSGQ